MYRNPHRALTSQALALMLIGLTSLTAALAQVGPQPIYVTPDVPGYSGALIKLRVETPTLMTFGTTTLSYLYQPAGRFQIQTSAQTPSGGDPTRTGDENRLLASIGTPYSTATWGNEYSSKITIAIDTDPLAAGEGAYHDPHYLAVRQGTQGTLANLISLWGIPPAAGARDVAGEFRVPVEETLNAETDEWITGRQVLTVIGDMVQIEYILTNESRSSHNVGLRILIDGMFGGASVYDGRPIVLPDGRVLETERTLPDPNNPNDILPPSWVSYDNPAAPTTVVRGILNGTEVFSPGYANSAAGLPDAVSWGQMRSMGVAEQYYTRTSAQAPLTGEDWAYAVTWAPRILQPGESRRYVTYYGMGNSSADYEPPYAFMAYGPFALQQRVGDDASTPDTVEQFYLTDEMGRSPFPVAAYMDNFGTTSLFDASVRIRLPVGLDLAPGESLTKSAGVVQRNEIKSVDWDLLATAARPGRTEIKFTGPRGKTVTRPLNIPAVPVMNPLPGGTTGLEMVSVPYNFADNDAEWVFQSLGSLLPGGPATIIRFDPSTNEYRWFPDPATTTITPGVAFWLLNRNREQVVLPADATPVDNSTAQVLELRPGWNQIGNPYTSALRMDTIRVAAATGGEWSLEEAMLRNMLLPTLYAYDPATNSYTWALSPQETYLDPYRGYWLLVRQNLSLIFTPPSTYAPTSARPVVAAATATDGWQVDVRVSAPGMNVCTQSLATRTDAERGLDRFDVPEPPASVRQNDVYLRSAFYSGASALGMPYLVDTRGSSDARQEWNLIVSTNAVNTPITVTWPSLNKLPHHLIATLVDETAGERRYMRTTQSYTFRSGSEPTERVLKVVVQPRPEQGLAVTGVVAAQAAQGGVMVTYTLSAEAAVDVRIRNIAGVVVGEAARDRLSPAGRNTVLWNGRNARGTRVPAGRYLCEIGARSPETGQAVSIVQPLELKR